MNFKIYQVVVSGAILALATVANAQNFTGSVGIQEDTTQVGAYTSSSLTMDISNYTEPFSGSGTFASTIVPNGTEAFCDDPATITGLSATPISLDLNDFVVIGGAGPALFGSPGTTPNDRFDFTLLTLEESNPTDGSFIGTGTLVDSQGAYAETSAELFLNFSGPNNYSFTLEAVPEPTTISLVAAGLMGFGAMSLRRRKS